MESSQVEYINTYQSKLVRRTKVDTLFLEKLMNENVITKADTLYILSQKGNETQALRLYGILKTKPNSYSKLMKALVETKQKKAYELLSKLPAPPPQAATKKDHPSLSEATQNRETGNTSIPKEPRANSYSKKLKALLMTEQKSPELLSKLPALAPEASTKKNRPSLQEEGQNRETGDTSVPAEHHSREWTIFNILLFIGFINYLLWSSTSPSLEGSTEVCLRDPMNFGNNIADRLETTLYRRFEKDMFSSDYTAEEKEMLVKEVSKFFRYNLASSIQDEVSAAIDSEGTRKMEQVPSGYSLWNFIFAILVLSMMLSLFAGIFVNALPVLGIYALVWSIYQSLTGKKKTKPNAK